MGRVCVVTGSTRGIGRALTVILARRGCTVWAVCRDEAGGAALAADVDGDVRPVVGDLASLAETAGVAERILADRGPVHVLVNNAAAVFDTWGETSDGLERQWAINHVAPFLLTRMLAVRLAASAPARVLTVSSRGHALGRIRFDDPGRRSGYGALGAYRQSKLANVLFTAELARRLAGTGVTANSLHPGEIRTDLGAAHTTGPIRWLWRLLAPFQRSPELAAEEIADLALSEVWADTSGAYFCGGRPRPPAPRARRLGDARRLWALTERQVAHAR